MTETEELARFEQLGEHFMRLPLLSQYEEVRAAIGRTTNCRDAWERLVARDLVPMSWDGSDLRRVFVKEPFPSRDGASLRTSPFPTTIEGIATIASNVDRVLSAEGAAGEWYERRRALVPLPRLTGFAWRVLPQKSGLAVRPDWHHGEERWLQSYAFGAMSVALGYEFWASVYPPYGPMQNHPAARRAARAVKAVGDGVARKFGIPRDDVTRRILPEVPLQDLEATVFATVIFDEASDFGVMLEPESHSTVMVKRWERITRPTPFRDLKNPMAPKLDVYDAGFLLCGVHESPEGARIVIEATAMDSLAMPRYTFRR